MSKSSPKPLIRNQEIAPKLSQFDYAKLTHKSWFDYLDLTIGKLAIEGSRVETRKNKRSGGLVQNHLYDYEVWRCVPVKEQLNPDDERSPNIIVGIRLRSNEPEVVTRITAETAKILNQQLDGFTIHNPGLYYLIKKVQPIAEEVEEYEATEGDEQPTRRGRKPKEQSNP